LSSPPSRLLASFANTGGLVMDPSQLIDVLSIASCHRPTIKCCLSHINDGRAITPMFLRHAQFMSHVLCLVNGGIWANVI
jgi:hypothetical protein